MSDFAQIGATFSCNTCGIRFLDSDSQKFHMKSDWHRYNLKRRVAELPTISLTVFLDKVSKAQIDVNSTSMQNRNDEDEYGFAVHKRGSNKLKQRQITKKDMKKLAKSHPNRFLSSETESPGVRSPSPHGSEFSELSLGDSVHSEFSHTDTHSINSTDSRYVLIDAEVSDGEIAEDSEDELTDKYVEFGSDSDEETDEETDEEYYDPLSVNGCLFCNLRHRSLAECTEHMLQHHGLYIPNREKLLDEEDLLSFLWIVLDSYKECLICGFIGKSLESIQDHVISKGHCKMPYESAEDRELFSQFYKADDATDKVEFSESKKQLSLPSGTKIVHRSTKRQQQLRRLRSAPQQSSLTVLAADKRLQRVNLGGLTKIEHEKSFKKMTSESNRQHNVETRRRLNNKRVGNTHKHLVDPNRPGS